MTNCLFCKEKRPVKSDSFGEGIHTMSTMLEQLFGCDNGCKKQDAIWLEDGHKLGFDNSSGEYAAQFVNIQFCPFCGERLGNQND